MRIEDPNPEVEAILRQIEAKANKAIVGPDGETLLTPVVDDRRITYAKEGQSYSIEPDELLMRAARMFRDGYSLRRIRDELDLIKTGPQAVSLRTLQSAILHVGMPWLEAAIADGTEPEESVRVVGYEVPDDGEPEPTPETRPAPDVIGPSARRARERLGG